MASTTHDVTGQTALITGGATGIGRAMAEALGKLGAKVWLAPMWRRGKSAEYVRQSLESGRIRPAEYIAWTILYLASRAGAAINGQVTERGTLPPLGS